MPKLKVFLWQLCRSSLPTRGTLLKRGLPIDPLCPLCHNDIEDSEHLFLKCPLVHEVWHLAKVYKWLSIPLRVALGDTLQSWLAKLRNSPTPVPLDRVVALLWSVWKSRNDVVFCNETLSPVVTLIRAKKTSAEWRIRHKLTNSIQPSPHLGPSPSFKKSLRVAWKKPPQHFIKLNSDGSKVHHQASGGYVLCNWTGHVLQAGAFPLGAASILVAEATALRNGLRAVVDAGFRKILIESDNQILIEAIQGFIQPPWEIQVLVQDINLFIQSCVHVGISHIFREANRAADWLAKLGLSLSSTCVWNQVSDRDLLCILHQDHLSYTLERNYLVYLSYISYPKKKKFQLRINDLNLVPPSLSLNFIFS